ncbi:MAG: cation transporter [Clostridia bacterium]|nr:cation transporter [Clostridia bacterium]
MTELLLRLFVKNYKNPTNPKVHLAIGRLAGTVGIFCNALLSLVKMFAGILSGSVSIIADGMNNLSDTMSSVITLLGFRMANKPADKDHPYGHARYEYLSGLLVAIFVIIVGVELIKSSVEKIISPSLVDFSALTLGILVVSILLKVWMTLFYKGLGKRIKSQTLKAAALDSRNDVIATIAVLIGAIIERTYSVNVDGYMGLLVAIFILVSGIKAVGETISPILGKRADAELVEAITQLVLGHDKILGVHDILVHDYGPGQCFASLHAELSAEEDPIICHDIIDDIECDAYDELNVRLVIHYDPVEVNNAERKQMEKAIGEILENISPDLSFHDFRIVRSAKQTKLVFDLAVPYSMEMQAKEIKDRIDDAVKEKDPEYTTFIRFDEKA